jgi:hypothetical protein
MGTEAPIEKALKKPVPKAGMGFFVIGRQSKILLNPFKGTVLIGEGKKVKVFNYVPFYIPMLSSTLATK